MRTAASWTDRIGQHWRRARHDVVDVGILMRFRARGVRHPGRARAALGLLLVLLIGSATVPALTPGAGGDGRAFDLLLLAPTMMSGFLLLAVASAVASGGGRELMSRDEALAYPVSPTTDHLGALVLAPLNIAWIVQACLLLGVTSYAIGTESWWGLLGIEVFLVAWLVFATATGQVVAWVAESVRRTRSGVWVLRGLVVAAATGVVVLQVRGQVTQVLDAVPTVRIFSRGLGLSDGDVWRWGGAVALVLAAALAAAALGAWPAHVAARLMPRDEANAETRHHVARAVPASDLAMLVRIDRASVWRTVPMRRGLTVLALGPGLVALAGGLPWANVLVLPGLVASGGVLLYGVNAWCLDERGALWRESLPVSATAVFDARTWVLAEWLLCAGAVTLALSAIRAGVPTPGEAASVLAVLVVVTLQVVAVAMHWSNRRPFAVNMRSARATPAPPAVMVAYSAKLATSTTLTAVCFTLTAQATSPLPALVLAAPFCCWSTARLLRARAEWADPVSRARVVTTVAA